LADDDSDEQPAATVRRGGRTVTTYSASDPDLAWCYEVVTEVSRTFAITVSELDEPMARDVCVGYLVCRVADTVEDDPRIPSGEKARLLRTYDLALDPETDADGTDFEAAVRDWVSDGRNPDWDLVGRASRVLGVFEEIDAETRERIRPPVREMVDGMAEFVERHEGGIRIGSVEELEEYCWYVAGTVGDLVTNLVAKRAAPDRVERMEEGSRDFGLLLQLVNVAKDVGTDFEEENNVYLPGTWLAEAGVDADEVGDPAATDRVATVVERTADHATSYLDGAQSWLEAMPEHRGNVLSAWGIPFLLAVGTLRELERRPADPVVEGDVKVSRPEVAAVKARFDDGVTAEDLGTLREMIRERPLHEW
jgi:farnesyl-diphosphate farnesyltransferase